MTPIRTPVRRLRRGSLSVALWLFGLSTTVLLVGIWGRAVASDEEAIVGGTRAVLESEAVAGRITNWIGDGMASAADGLPAAVRGDAADAVWDRPEMQAVIGDVVRRFVDAALAPTGATVSIDLGEAVLPLAPVVQEELAARGVELSVGLIATAFEALPVLDFETDAELGIVSAVAEARAALTLVVAIALVGMALSAAAAIALAENRLRQLKTLAVRVAVSAVTFAVLLRVGAWALDPRGGRSPLAAGGSHVLGSGLHVLVFVAAAAAVVGFIASAGVRRRRRGSIAAA